MLVFTGLLGIVLSNWEDGGSIWLSECGAELVEPRQDPVLWPAGAGLELKHGLVGSERGLSTQVGGLREAGAWRVGRFIFKYFLQHISITGTHSWIYMPLFL